MILKRRLIRKRNPRITKPSLLNLHPGKKKVIEDPANISIDQDQKIRRIALGLKIESTDQNLKIRSIGQDQRNQSIGQNASINPPKTNLPQVLKKYAQLLYFK